MRGTALRVVERNDILRGIGANLSARQIAVGLGRDPSVVSREIARNGGRADYRVDAAQERFESLLTRPKPRKLEANRRLHDEVNAGLALRWSPRQISARLKRVHPDDEAMRVSHETIYETLYVQARGELRTELKLALRRGRYRRVPAGSTRVKAARIAGMVNISERPAEVADRAVPGHWEGDILKGRANGSAVGTLVERSTRLVLLARMPGLDSRSVVQGFARKLGSIPQPLRQSMTYDQGREMARHELLSKKLKLQIYFADPHSPWQRGTNENTNGLLRQYLPKSADLTALTQRELNAIAARLNNRPRQTLNWMTPNEAWKAQLKSFNVALGT